jgi:hypothetical protein
MSENIENNDSLNVEEATTEIVDTGTEAEVELELEDTSSEETKSEVDAEKLKETNKKLFIRLMKAEGKTLVDGKWVKASKPAPVVQTKKDINSNEQYLTREEAILIAKGYEDSELAKLKAVAKGNGCSLLDATKDEMFVLWKEKQDEEVKKSKSKLGASKGSGSVRAEKSVSDMTKEEHEAYVRKAFGN